MWSSGPSSSRPDISSNDIYAHIRQAGYEAVQGGDADLCAHHGLELIGVGVVQRPQQAAAFVSHWQEQGAIAATCIAGFGIESDEEIDSLVDAISAASAHHQLPVYIETHRASITQDVWRTLQLITRRPGTRFNLDFSHWFTGQEMAYGNFPDRLSRLEPVLSRTSFVHGRIGDRCSMQVDIGDGEHPSVPFFRRVWTRAFEHFLARPNPSDPAELWFVPELLGTHFQYARTFLSADGTQKEESDRWQQATVLALLAKEIFQDVSSTIHLQVPR